MEVGARGEQMRIFVLLKILERKNKSIGNSTGGRVVKRGLTEEMKFQQILEKVEEVSRAVAGAMESRFAFQLMPAL